MDRYKKGMIWILWFMILGLSMTLLSILLVGHHHQKETFKQTSYIPLSGFHLPHTDRISVVIPCIPKHVHKLPSCFRSIALQTTKPYQVFVALSESATEDSVRILESHLQGVPLVISCTTQPANAAENRNRATKLVTTPYVTYMDADDQMHPYRIAILDHYLRMYDKDVVLHGYSPQQEILSNQCRVYNTLDPYVQTQDPLGPALHLQPMTEWEVTHGHITLRTSLAQQVPQETQKAFRRCEDSRWVRYWILKKYHIVYLDVPLSIYVPDAEQTEQPRIYRSVRNLPIMWLFWHDLKHMSATRQEGLHKLMNTISLPTQIVTLDTLSLFVKDKIPKAFQYLSGVHQSDYMRFYLIHHYGGLYHDIKPRTEKVNIQHYIELLNNTNIWIIGVQEIHADDIAQTKQTTYLANHYQTLISPVCFMGKPQTPLTQELLQTLNQQLKEYENILKEHPAPYPRCCQGGQETYGYPLRWAELAGEKWHPLTYKYRQHINRSFPRWAQNISYL